MKTRLSRPHEMRTLKLSAHDYKLIGEIAVLSGMLEMEMKQAIVKLVDAPWPEGLALVVHLNFGSLCDIAEALLPRTIKNETLKKIYKEAVVECRGVYEQRNSLIHGPFSPILKAVTGVTGMFKITARAKMNFKTHAITTDKLERQLIKLIGAYDYLWYCQDTLERERAGQYPFPQSPQTRKSARKATGRKA